jgi:hypothetical protein
MMWEDGVLLLLVVGVCVPMVAAAVFHERRMLQYRIRATRDVRLNVGGDIEQLKRQVTELRDLTTKYDLSFDQTLQRIESRVSHIENRVVALEQADRTEAHTR